MILIRDSRIVKIGNFSRMRVPRGSLVIDGSGKFAIPGLWDMHVHIRGSMLGNKGSFVPENETMLPVYLANGVTGVREMGGDLVDTVVLWQK
jgi:imidazolonepropionase-like amidohydrolase